MSFNQLLSEAGDFGRYQKLLCFCFLYPSIAAGAFTFWAQVFILLSPPHRCRLTTFDTWENNISLYEGVTVKECSVSFDTTSNASLPYLQQWIFPQPSIHGFGNSSSEWMTIPCPEGWVYDYSLYYPTISTEQNWICGDSWKMYVIHTCYWVGVVCGFGLFGTISDRFGRKRSFQASVLLMVIADATTILASSHSLFAVLRFLAAMGRGSISTVAFLLAMEYTGPTKRILTLGVWCFSWVSGSAIFPLVPYILRSWRGILGISIVPCCLILLVSFFVPESASWLITRGRMDEAARLIHRLASVNGKKLSLDYIKQKLQMQDSTPEVPKMKTPSPDECDRNGESDKPKRGLTYVETFMGLFKTPNMRKKTILLIIVWMIAACCYNGTSIGLSNLPFNVYLSYSIGAILELPPKIFCLFALDRVGRRWANFGFFAVTGTVGLIIFLLKPGADTVFVLAMVVRSGQAAVFDITFTFSSESFPTAVRGWGTSIIRISGGISSAVAPLIVSLSEYYPLSPLGIFGLLSLLAGVVTLFIPETAGQHLPHTLEDGEAFGKDQNFCFCPFRQKGDFAADETLKPSSNDEKELTGINNPAMDTQE